MKLLKIFVGLIFFIAPVLGRYFWLYQGVYERTEPVEIPEYEDFVLPQPPLSSSDEEIQLAQAKDHITVLIDRSHDNIFTLSEIESLRQELVSRGAQVEVSGYDTILSESLKYANAYIIISPGTSFYEDEIQAVNTFVQRGGKLLVITDPTRRDYFNYGTDFSTYDLSTLSSLEIANLVLASYDIAFSNDYIYNVVENEGNFRNVIFEDFESDPLTEGLETVVLYGAHSITSGQFALLTGSDQTLSSITDKGDDLTSLVKHKDGFVLAVGDIGFMTPPFNKVADNQVLIQNITSFLIDSDDRVKGLQEFPYLFRQPVAIISQGDEAMDSEMVSMITNVQSAVANLGYPTMISIEPPESGYDLIVFGTFNNLDDLVPYIADFELVMGTENIPESEIGDSFYFVDEAPTREVVTIPNIGTFTTEGIGLILFNTSNGQNTVILLASSTESLAELGRNIINGYGGDLSSCFIHENIGVCQLQSVDTEYLDYNYDDFFEEDFENLEDDLP